MGRAILQAPSPRFLLITPTRTLLKKDCYETYYYIWNGGRCHLRGGNLVAKRAAAGDLKDSGVAAGQWRHPSSQELTGIRGVERRRAYVGRRNDSAGRGSLLQF